MFEVFNNIEFFEENHQYRFKNAPHIVPTSVTGLTGALSEPVNEKYWLKRKADDYGVTEAEVKAEWDYKANLGTLYGSACHLYLESIYNCIDFKYPSMGIAAAFNDDPVMPRFKKTKPALDRLVKKLDERLDFVGSEIRVGDEEWRVTGTLDALFKSKKTGKYYIFDWKTNKEYNFSSRYKLKAPYQYLDNCEHVKYSFQTGFYKAIIEKHLDIVIDASYICWINENNPDAIINKTQDYMKEVYEILNARIQH